MQLTFLLVNDSDSAVDVKAGSWKIRIDGVELVDSGYIFGNGPVPARGWTALEAGQHYEFGKTLPIDRYFREGIGHKVSWSGTGFRSSTVMIKIPGHP